MATRGVTSALSVGLVVLLGGFWPASAPTSADSALASSPETPQGSKNLLSRARQFSAGPLPPATDFFSQKEVRQWRDYRQSHRLVSWSSWGANLVLHLLLLGVWGRWLKGRSAWAAQRLGRTGLAHRRSLLRLRGLLRRAVGDDWLTVALFAAGYFFLRALWDLPFSLWHEYLSQKMGLSNYTPLGWVDDLLKQLLLASVFFALLVAGIYGLVRRFTRFWWVFLSVPTVAALVALGFLAPYQTRVFYDVTPLAETDYAKKQTLTQRLERLARSQGFALSQIKVVNSSRTSNALNAYLSGMGPTRELVLFDTLLQSATIDEIEVVLAHEIAHRKLESPLVAWLLPALGLVLFLALLSQVFFWGSRWLGFSGPGDVRTLPLVGLTALLAFTLVSPLGNYRSRKEELQADRLALVLTQKPEAFIALQVKIARRNKADVAPSSWARFWHSAHPSTLERIALAQGYRRVLEKGTTQRHRTRAGERDNPAP